MEVAAKVGTSLALSALPPLLNKLSSKLGGDVTKEEMEHLDDFVRYEIVALTKEANSDDLVRSTPLLEKLQAAALELEDLLDLYEYNQLEKQVSSSSSSNPIKKLKPIFKERLRPILPKSPLRIGVEKLLKFIAEVEKLHPFIMSRKGTTQPPATTVTSKTSTPSSPFYGRGDQYDMIIKILLDESHTDLNSRTKNVPIIAIRGLGGAGKTTIAQHIYNENRIENYFDLRMWVDVTRAFDEQSLIKQTIESAEKKACDQISSLDVLQKKLIDSVSKKKFLLVLDDVWDKDMARLDILLTPLNQVGEKGSRIILTTRMQKVAEDLRAKPIILLDELKDEDCWSILKYYAFDGNEEILENDPELKYVGNQIINKVNYSPLALKVVGSSIRNKKGAKEWKNFLQQDILKETMDLLLFSYQCLPLHLQRCFAYCSLFPKGYRFDINFCAHQPHLIYLWIAHGFIENTSELTPEEVGKKYIEELISYSFFEMRSQIRYGDCFVIHDLLHDLAEKVSKKQCHRIEHDDSLHVPTTCVHLSLCITENMVSTDQSTMLAISNVFNLRNLRSLIILHLSGLSIFEGKKNTFQNITKLRALYVEDYEMEVLSVPHIGKLKHLRYLHVRHDSKLPASLVKLYQLQFFILNACRSDGDAHLSADTLPQDFNNLTNLRTLQFSDVLGREVDYLYYNSKMINVGKPKSLQNLNFFHVDAFNEMISLRDLALGGSLSIINLENIKCKEEAEEAMLNRKKNIDELNFVWNSTPSSIDTCEKVLEGLEPHRNLERLEINGYQSAKFAEWLVKENRLPRLRSLSLKSCASLKIVPSLPSYLQKLSIRDCDELIQLPPLSGTILDLELVRCPKLQAVTTLSPTLTRLCIEYCPNLTVASTFNKSPSLFDLKVLANLERLRLGGFPNLQALANLSPTVTELRIEHCPKLTSLGNLQRCTSLKELKIIKCPMVRREEASLVEGVVEADTGNRHPLVDHIYTDEPLLVLDLVQQQAFSSIKYLRIYGCAAAALPNLEILSSLESLVIWDSPDIESLPKLPASLQSLWVWGCPKLKEMHEEGGPLHLDLKGLSNLEKLSFLYIKGCPAIELLPNLPDSLRWLRIKKCPAIEFLPNLPDSLEWLRIQECPKLKEKYEEGGPLRHTISRIPNIDMY